MSDTNQAPLTGLKHLTPRSSELLLAVAARASYWWERRDHDCVEPVPNAPGDEAAATLRDRWCHVVSKGDRETFETRLRWDGIDPEEASRLLDVKRVDAKSPLPRWALTLHEFISCPSDNTAALFDERDPIPFEHLLEPAVRVARAQLRSRCTGPASHTGMDPTALLSDAAHRTLERALLRRLAALAARTLYVEFCSARPYGVTLLGMLDEDAVDVPGTTDYARFVERMWRDGLLGFFCRYAVLGRLLATAVDQWVDATAELLQRLSADRDAIERCLFAPARGVASDLRNAGDGSGFLVTGIQTSLSDTHKGGRTVAVLTLADGRKLVYKPKNLSLEVALSAFLDWCNRGDAPQELRVVRVLAREAYGWVEYVEHAPCPDLDAARRFYRRAGMLLCILHVLGATDCHHGNIIASGEDPVLVDAETLLHPDARPIDEDHPASDPDPITRNFLDSVLRTSLLPEWHVSGDGQVAYDVSGLGGAGGDALPDREPHWRWINTDAMVLRYRRMTLPVDKNVVRVGEQTLVAVDFEPEITAGFDGMYRQLMSRRDALLRLGSPLTAMQRLPMRFVFRATRVYVTLLTNAWAEHLEEGAGFSIELDYLSRAFLVSRTRPANWPILGAELRALGQLDVPYFTGNASSDALEIGDGTTVPHYVRRAGYLEAVERISQLGDDDLRWQLALIHGSFQARIARNTGSGARVATRPAPAPLAAAVMVAEAERLARELDRRGIFDAHGEANWLGLSLVAATERVQLQLIGESLYEGRCGVALFLAALHRATAAPRVHELVQAALESVRRLSRTIDGETRSGSGARSRMLGPAAIGSMIYALVKIGEFLAESEPLDHAQTLAASITADDVASDRAFDVLTGSAGAILGLVALHRATGNSVPLEQARAFGHHLVEHQVSFQGAPRAWQNIGTHPLAGFSHGAAGIAYALLRLYQACGDERFRTAAFEGIAYERGIFSPANGNWPDLREADNGQVAAFPVQWCHGAAGIALARLGSRRVVPDPSFDADVDVALRTTQGAGLKAVDHLCCGNMGRIEALWVGANGFGRADWHDAALTTASQVLARTNESGSYQLFPNLPCDVFNPGFFRGAAGIGYQWLRLAFPDLPSVLMWE